MYRQCSKLLNQTKTPICLRIKRFSHMERKIKVNGLDINFVITGKGDKNVLLMPGAAGSIWTAFKSQIEQLPKMLPNHTIIAWDPPGYGKSIPPNRQWGLDTLHKDAQWAVALMNTLEKPKFSIMGWSGGGITGLITAGRYVDNVEKLIIWGARAYVVSEDVKFLQNLRDINKWSTRMREPMEKVYGVKRFAELWAGWVDLISSFYMERQGDVCKQEVELIKAPTLIVHGNKDPVISSRSVEYLRKRIKNSRYHEFAEGKHNVHLRYDKEFNQLVANFLLEDS